MPQANESPHSGTTIPAIDWTDPAELALRLKHGPDGLKLIQKRFQLKGGDRRPDHHGTPGTRRPYDRAVMLENLQRLKNASDGVLASTTIYDSLEEEPVDGGVTE